MITLSLFHESIIRFKFLEQPKELPVDVIVILQIGDLTIPFESSQLSIILRNNLNTLLKQKGDVDYFRSKTIWENLSDEQFILLMYDESVIKKCFHFSIYHLLKLPKELQVKMMQKSFELAENEEFEVFEANELFD